MRTRIDPRYFNRFMLLGALFSLVLIAFFTLRQPAKAREAFAAVLQSAIQTPWSDDVPVLHTPVDPLPCGPSTVHLFWAPWSDRSLRILDTLASIQAETAQPGPCHRLLGVKEAPDRLRETAASSMLQGTWVDGTQIYGEWNVPGVPTLFITEPSGDTLHLRALEVGIDPERVEAFILSALSESPLPPQSPASTP